MFQILANIHWEWDIRITEFFNQWAQASEFIRKIFLGFSYLGTEYVFIALFAILYFMLDKKMAKDVGYAAFYGMVVNNVIKGFFSFLRPFQQEPQRIKCYDESILAKDIDGNYIWNDPVAQDFRISSSSSFPSGHSQGSSGVYNSLGKASGKLWIRIVAVVLCVLVMISRMVLGVHSFVDVFTGFLVGIAVLELIFFLRSKVKNELWLHIGLLSGLTIIVFLSQLWAGHHARDAFTTLGTAVGLVFGIMFEEKKTNFHISKKFWKNLLRLVGGVIVAFFVKIVFKMFYSSWTTEGTFIANFLDFLRYFLMVFLTCGIYTMQFKVVPFLKDDEEEPIKETQEA